MTASTATVPTYPNTDPLVLDAIEDVTLVEEARDCPTMSIMSSTDLFPDHLSDLESVLLRREFGNCGCTCWMDADPDIDDTIVDGDPHTELNDIVGWVPPTAVVLVIGGVDTPPKAGPEAEMDPSTESVVAKLAPVVVLVTGGVDTSPKAEQEADMDQSTESVVAMLAPVVVLKTNFVIDLETDETKGEDTEV